MGCEKGLYELADGVWAYLQPGSWGWSNAGLITDVSASMLVDSRFDPDNDRPTHPSRRT